MQVSTTAAISREPAAPWEVIEVTVPDPGVRQVRVRMVAAALCGCDEHARCGAGSTGFPLVGGHQGIGVVDRVGPAVTRVGTGDTVVLSAAPVCGTCRFCSTARQHLCEGEGPPPARFRTGAGDAVGVAGLGTLAGYLVASEFRCVPLREPLPAGAGSMLGCSVPAGWGTAVRAAGVRAGDTVVVYGAGGVGAAAVIGARQAGARHVVAVDPVAFKRERAVAVGATHTAATAAQAQEFVADTTWGRLAEHALVTVDRLDEEVLTDALEVVGKMGLVTVTARGDAPVRPAGRFIGFQRTVQGTRFGGVNPLVDIPRLVSLHTAGRIDLAALVTREYRLDRIADVARDMGRHAIVRGVVVHDQGAAA